MANKVIKLDPGYKPNPEEPFMNDRQREYFRRKLMNWKDEILRDAEDTLTAMQADTETHPDLVDRASSEGDRAIELRARDRQRKLISKIDSALSRIVDGSYGARKLASRSACKGWMRARSPRFRWKRRNGTSGARKSTATTDAGPRLSATQIVQNPAQPAGFCFRPAVTTAARHREAAGHSAAAARR